MQAFDEMGVDGKPVRPPYAALAGWLAETPGTVFDLKRREASALFRRIGITFAVYGEGGDPERLIPFDIMPRVLDAAEWRHLEKTG